MSAMRPPLRITASLAAALLLGPMAIPDAHGYIMRGQLVANGATPGGGLAGSGRLLLGSAGQPAVGVSAAASKILWSGYWACGGSRVVSVDDDAPGTALPAEFAIGRPYPNPAQGAVRFALALPRPARVQLLVLDVQGRAIATRSEHFDAGDRALAWDGHDASGQRVRAGIYFARLLVDGQPTALRRIVLRD